MLAFSLPLSDADGSCGPIPRPETVVSTPTSLCTPMRTMVCHRRSRICSLSRAYKYPSPLLQHPSDSFATITSTSLATRANQRSPGTQDRPRPLRLGTPVDLRLHGSSCAPRPTKLTPFIPGSFPPTRPSFSVSLATPSTTSRNPSTTASSSPANPCLPVIVLTTGR